MKEHLNFIWRAKESGDFENWIDEHIDTYDGDLGELWFFISTEPLTTGFIERHKDELFWKQVCKFSILSETFMDDHLDYVDWLSVSERQNFGLEFTMRHRYDLDWQTLIMRFKYPEDLLMQLIDDEDIHLDIGCVLQNQVLSRENVERLTKVYSQQEIESIREERRRKSTERCEVPKASSSCEAMFMDVD